MFGWLAYRLFLGRLKSVFVDAVLSSKCPVGNISMSLRVMFHAYKSVRPIALWAKKTKNFCEENNPKNHITSKQIPSISTFSSSRPLQTSKNPKPPTTKKKTTEAQKKNTKPKTKNKTHKTHTKTNSKTNNYKTKNYKTKNPKTKKTTKPKNINKLY